MTEMPEPGRDWRPAFSEAGIDPEGIQQRLFEAVGLPRDCPMLLAGSIAEGLAVSSSDIDLYAICRPGEVRGGMLAGRDQVSVAYGNRHLDLTLLDPDWLCALIARLQDFCARQPPSNTQADTFSTIERMTLHRLASGLPISGVAAVAQFRSAISDRHLRLKRHCAAEMIKRRKFSAQSLVEAGDHRNLLFMCRDIADETADLLLAEAGDGSVALKWRLRRLGRAYPVVGSKQSEAANRTLWPALHNPAETYFRLSHFPTDDRMEASLRYARQVIGWADLASLWCTGSGQITDQMLAAGSSLAAQATFRLRLDCSLACVDGAFLIQRLNSEVPGWEISPEAAVTLAHINSQENRQLDAHAAWSGPQLDINALAAFLQDEGFIDSTAS